MVMKQKTKTHTIIRLAVSTLALIVMTLSYSPFAYAEPLSLAPDVPQTALRVTAFDTLLGIEGLIKVSGAVPYESVQITVIDPQSAQNRYFKYVNSTGALELALSSSALVRSGTYSVLVRTATQAARTEFEVFSASSLQLGDAIGGDPETTVLGLNDANYEPQLVAVDTPPHHFVIENLPASVTVSDKLNFSVRAVDANNTTVTSYRGTVHFSSDDHNADLPNNYTFTASDLGKKTFDLGLTLRTTGTQKVKVEDTVTPTIKGEQSVSVLRGTFDAGSGEIYITKPAPGTYSAKTQVIEGGAPQNVKVQIFDNNQQIGETQSNTGGRFSFTTSLLTDGPHRFYVESNGNQSAPVDVTIDSTPARVENVQIGATTVAPGATTSITVTSDADLSDIKATVGDYITDLTQDSQNPTQYKGELVAPTQAGEHTVTVIISDKLGNSAPPQEVGTLRVDNALQNTGNFSFSVPSTVTNVQALGVLNGVTLTWTAAQAEAGILSYKIYYGTTPNDLGQVTDTKSAQTSYIVENLKPGTQYFFRLSALDTRGNESDNLSNMVSATASNSAVVSAAPANSALANSLAICEPGPCPTATYAPYTPYNGPALLIPVLGSLVGGAASFLRKKKN